MKKLLTNLLSAAVLFTVLILLACGSSDKVRIAVEGAYPPFSETLDGGEVVGFDIDIAAALCAEAEIECENITQDWDGMIPGLLAKKYDAIIASMSITEERKQKVNFTKKYYSSTASFVAHADSDLVLGTDVAENKKILAGKQLGAQEATVSATYLADNYGDVADIKLYGKQEEVTIDLVNGRLDAIIADTVVIDDGFLKTDEGVDFKLISPGYSDESWFGEGIGIAVRKEDEELLGKFNNAIDAIRVSGEYEDIQALYFDYDIYGE